MFVQDPVALFIQFFQRALPRFSPQAETLFSQLSAEELQAQQFRYIFSVDTMVRISHMIEDAAVQASRPAELHVSFQYLSRIKDQCSRYERIASKVAGLWLYAVPDTPLPSWSNTHFVDTSNSALVNYWFLIAYGPGLSMTLIAEEKEHGANNRFHGRIYEGFYTFEEEIAYKVLNLIHLIFPTQVAAPVPPELL
ncbi:MAG: hypothetical protein N3A60_08100 [Thermanaerothrix sp.]|nr:hypothetical protein [Thermanaerothrix sp.]